MNDLLLKPPYSPVRERNTDRYCAKLWELVRRNSKTKALIESVRTRFDTLGVDNFRKIPMPEDIQAAQVLDVIIDWASSDGDREFCSAEKLGSLNYTHYHDYWWSRGKRRYTKNPWKNPNRMIHRINCYQSWDQTPPGFRQDMRVACGLFRRPSISIKRPNEEIDLSEMVNRYFVEKSKSGAARKQFHLAFEPLTSIDHGNPRVLLTDLKYIGRVRKQNNEHPIYITSSDFDWIRKNDFELSELADEKYEQEAREIVQSGAFILSTDIIKHCEKKPN